MQPRQHQSSAAQMAQHTNCARKGKRKKRKEREREEKKWEIKSQKKTKKKQKKKKKKKHLHTHTFFSHSDPCAMTFASKILAVLHFCSASLSRITYLLLFSSKLRLTSSLYWIPEVNIQLYPHFGCIFQNPRPF